MKKSFIFGLFATTIGAVAAGLVISNSGVAIGGFAGGDSQAIWKHYAQKDATATEKGIREYWIECDGDYQFTAPQGVTVVEGTAYDTSEFTQDDPRWLTYVSGSVFYNMATSAYDYREVGTALDGYTPFNEVDKTTYGAKLNAVYTKAGSPSLMVEQLTITKFITTNEELYQAVNCVTAGASLLAGYWVVANDLTAPTFGAGWTDPCWSNKVEGTLDGRGHVIISPYVSNHAGLFGASNTSKFTIKDLEFRTLNASGSGLLGYNSNGITFKGCKIVSMKGSGADGIVGRAVQNVTFIDCYLDLSAEPAKPVIGVVKNYSFTNTTVKGSKHNGAKLFTKSYDTVYVENYDEAGVTWVDDSYVFLPAAPANFALGAHGDGYHCEDCDKYFSDAGHKNEIAKEVFFTSEKLPTTKVEGKQVFYNLATSAFDVAEVPSLDTSKLVDAFGNVPSLAGKVAGNSFSLYLPGETNYEYDVVVVTDVLDTEAKFHTAVDASVNNVYGYYVLTKNLGNVTGAEGGKHDNTTDVVITIDGRNHSLDGLACKSSGHGGIFGTSATYKGRYEVTIKNLTVKSSWHASGSYGLFGYGPANSDGKYLNLVNCDITYANATTYGILGALGSKRIVIDGCRFSFNGKQATLFMQGAAPTFTGSPTTIVIDTALDTETTPNAIIKGNSANERTGLTSKIANVNFVQFGA